MNRTIRHTILFSMLGGIALSAAAWAQGDVQQPGMHQDGMRDNGLHGSGMFQRMDVNHDGRISAQEHAAAAQAMFARMDANHDGIVDAMEMKAGHDRKDRDAYGGMHG